MIATSVSSAIVAAQAALSAAERDTEVARREYRDARSPSEQEEALARLNAALRYRRSCAARLERLTGSRVESPFAVTRDLERAEAAEERARAAFLSAPGPISWIRSLFALRAACRRVREIRLQP